MAASQTDSARAPEDEAGAADLLSDSVSIGWGLFTSPATMMVLLAALAGVVAFGAVVTQGATEAELLARRDFADVAALRAFGLDHVAGSWLTWMLLLLASITAGGVFLRHVMLQPTALRYLDSWSGPAVSRANSAVARPVAEVASVVEDLVGGNPRTGDGGIVTVRRGLWSEGFVLLALGLVTLLGAAGLTAMAGLDARLALLPGVAGVDAEGNPIPPVTHVHTGGTWIERSLPIAMRCAATDPADPQRRRDCDVTDGQTTTQITVGAGRPAHALGYTIQPISERPLASRGNPTVLLRKPGAPAPEVLRGQHGSTYQLKEGTRLTTWIGPDGPLVVVRPAEGSSARAQLLAPAETPHAPPGMAGDRSVSAVSAWQVTMSVRSDPAHYLVLAGLGVLLLGLAALAAPGHLTVVARPRADGETELFLWSFNRPDTAVTTLAAVVARLEAGPGETS